MVHAKMQQVEHAIEIFPPPVRLRVLLPLPLANSYDYRAPEGSPVPLGSFVVVPLGRRRMIGVVWDGEPDPTLPEARLRGVEQVLDTPPMTETLRRFDDWVAAYPKDGEVHDGSSRRRD